MRIRKVLSVLLMLLLFTCCSAPAAQPEQQGQKQYTATFLELFDTVTTVMGYADSEEAFRAQAEAVRAALEGYHQRFDIYHTYEGVTNLKTINDNAGVAPVKVDRETLDLLLFCRDFYGASGGRVNAAMGSVLSLWHEARTTSVEDPAGAYIPSDDAIREAAQHIDFDTVVIDEAASTVFLSDPAQRLDVGAVAKGYAVQRVAETLPEGLVLSVGGNVSVTGPKPGGAPWTVGVQSPDGEMGDYLHTLALERGSVVTSGDYQRRFTVNGRAYHHIIDPATGYPAERYRAVTVICADSGAADALSTGIFLMDEAEGRALLAQYDAEALWILPDGGITMTDGFKALLRS